MSLFYIFQSSLVRNTFNALSGVTLDGILQQKLSLLFWLSKSWRSILGDSGHRQHFRGGTTIMCSNTAMFWTINQYVSLMIVGHLFFIYFVLRNKSESLSEMLATPSWLESSPAHKGPTNTNKMSKFLEERKELNYYRTFNSYTSFSFQYQRNIRAL